MSIDVHGKPLYVLTNQGCESTDHWSPEQFIQLGLEYSEWNGEDYPLTDEEAVLISDTHAITPADGTLLFGYSALFENKKWLMPSVEYMKPANLEAIDNERLTIEKLVAPYQGKVTINSDGPKDRIILLILVPMAIIQEEFRHASVWERYLERGIGISSEHIY